VDGTLAGGGTTGVVLTGGTIQGAGTLKTNVSSSAAINVGDAGKAGLLSITGTYTQLSSGTMNVSIGGTTVGTQYSQLKVSGTASLGGTLTAALVNAFTPTVGQSFTVLTGSSVSGTFTNTTIAINPTEHFVISYTSTSVVLAVASGPASKGSSSQPVAQTAMATLNTLSNTLKPVKVVGPLRHPIVTGASKTAMRKPVLLASAHSKAILASSGGAPRIWQHVPLATSWNHVKAVAVAQLPRPVNSGMATSNLVRSNLVRSNLVRSNLVRSNLVRSNLVRAENNLRSANNWVAQSHAVPAKVGNWIGLHNTRPEPIRIMKPVLPKLR
jgi:hypothetical protein